MNEVSAKCGQVKRKIKKNEPITGELLEVALDLLGDDEHKKRFPVFQNIADKLKLGKPLGEYELHIMLDVVLLHVRLGAK